MKLLIISVWMLLVCVACGRTMGAYPSSDGLSTKEAGYAGRANKQAAMAPTTSTNTYVAKEPKPVIVPPGIIAEYPSVDDIAGNTEGMAGLAEDQSLAPDENLPQEEFNQERYAKINDNPFVQVENEALSTFSIDVDTASYSNVRRFLTANSLPSPDVVRIEELLNYFSYDYPPALEEQAFSVSTELGVCPWNQENYLLHIGIQGNSLLSTEIPPCNLVFLLDVSGSMNEPTKLPLLKTAMGMLAERLRPQDKVSIVVYAGAAGLVLAPTSGRDKNSILQALSRLQAGGSTNGGQGIELAYQIAQNNLIPGAINRVILATDGDFNIGTTSEGDLVRLIETKRKTGIFLTVLGLGMYNLNDSTMEKLADSGNGNYAYIDTLAEAQKVLVDELTSTLVTIAKDVKIQIEFNPLQVESYRLIGYENRMLAAEDFNDDLKDAGEIGAGHTVTALYELVPKGGRAAGRKVDPLKYQNQPTYSDAAASEEISTLKIRYKNPQEDKSQLISLAIGREIPEEVSSNFRFSAAVASWGMILRDSPHKGNSTMELVRTLAKESLGEDEYGYRKEFLRLVDISATLIKMK